MVFHRSLSDSKSLLLSLLLLLLFYYLRVFHISVSDNKFPQVSRTLLSILVELNNAVVWIVSTYPLILKPSCPFTNPLVTVPRAPITIGITVIFMFYGFFQFPSKVQVLNLLSLSFSFTLWLAGTAKSTVLFFLLIIIRCDRLAEIKWSVCISKSQRSLCVSFSRTGCAYTICLYGQI